MKKKIMAGKIARKKSKDAALALERISPFCRPMTKNLRISSRLMCSLPGYRTRFNNDKTGSRILSRITCLSFAACSFTYLF